MRFIKPASLLAIILAVSLAVSWTAFAQQPKAPAAPAAPPAGSSQTGGSTGGTTGSATGSTDAGGADLGNIDEILEGEEEVLSGSGFSYDPGNRRDPFKSLLAAPDRPEIRGPRPEGVPGLLIDEIDLTGIFRTSKGFV